MTTVIAISGPDKIYNSKDVSLSRYEIYILYTYGYLGFLWDFNIYIAEYSFPNYNKIIILHGTDKASGEESLTTKKKRL